MANPSAGDGFGPEANPFLVFRHRLDSYTAAIEAGISDEAFVGLVGKLDAGVSSVEGRGFAVTPAALAPDLAEAAGIGGPLWVKDETGSVAGSHKSRHLYGIALHLLVGEALGAPLPDRLAIASCGNAALAAGVIAAALKLPLEVFVPTWADVATVARLSELGASVTRCERREGEAGDPAYLRFREAVAGGVSPFAVQGTETPSTFDGARTLGWELARQVSEDLAAIYVQVGGGALATAVGKSLPRVTLRPVQAEGCAPFRRAWDLLALSGFDLVAASSEPDRYMWPWTPEPTSAASGILDDVTYDWQPLVALTNSSGGEPIVATETSIVAAADMAKRCTEIPAGPTGTAGLAGLLTSPPNDDRPVAVLFTGRS